MGLISVSQKRNNSGIYRLLSILAGFCILDVEVVER